MKCHCEFPGLNPAPRNSRRVTKALCGRRLASTCVVGLVLACGGKTGDSIRLGGETHFLVKCSSMCGEPGLSCVNGACTRSCALGSASCGALAAGAECVAATVEPLPGVEVGLCEVACVLDADCTSLGDRHVCESGVCRAPDSSVSEAGSEDISGPSAAEPPTSSSTVGLGEGLLARFDVAESLGPDLVAFVDESECYSGLRWVGEDAPSVHMAPGSDCVGCHAERGAVPLAIGGTMYGPVDSKPGCFGLPGVNLTIVDALGRQWTTTTNAAGNFYFEGRPENFAYPYLAEVSWTNTRSGLLELPTMATSPLYGGCARCHGAAALDEPFPAQPPLETEPTDPEYVIPMPPVMIPGLGPGESPF